MLKKSILFLIIAILSVVLIACGSDDSKENNTDDSNTNDSVDNTNPDYYQDVTENPIVTITMDSGEQIKIELMPKVAPNTVASFISLAESGFYDGTIFHRVIPGFMIQGGDPTGTGTGGPDYRIDGEFTSNGFENNLLHERGVISMARAARDKNSAGSQFFIMVEAAPSLDGDYAAFGQVIEGMEVVDHIVSVETGTNDKPKQEQRMKSVVVDTKGFNYPQPVKNK